MKIRSDLGNRHPVTIDQLVMPAVGDERMDRGKTVYPLPLPVEWGYNKAPMTYDHAWFCY
jgi:hypothetical protein